MERVLAQEDFDAARFKAFRRAVLAVLRRRATRLLSLDRILASAGLEGKSFAGVQEIPLERIRGSAHEGKQRDFDPSFLPNSRRLRDRWARLYQAILEGEEIPPIDVYELDGDFYVIDGHHRVSVLGRLGRDTVPARVTSVRTRAPLGPGVDRHEILRAAEYSRFLEATHLDRTRPQARLEVSRLGRYEELMKHILGHRYFLGLERGSEPALEEAAASWYDTVYVPISEAVRRHRATELLKGWTETDIYVEVTRRWLELSEGDQESGPHPAIHALLDDEARRWWRRGPVLRLGR